MNFDALKDQLRDRFVEIWGRIQETSLYMSLREKYEALNVRTQKAIVACGVVLGVLFLLSFPYSYISSSQDSMSEFEDNRELIRNLLKASKNLKEISPLPPGMSSEDLATMVNRSLEEFHLIAEQVTAATPITSKMTNLVPDTVKQAGATLPLKKLNLQQVVEISHRLQTLSPGIKLLGLDIRENAGASHYFDVVFKVASFSVPEPVVPMGKAGKDKMKSKSKDSDSDDAGAAEE